MNVVPLSNRRSKPGRGSARMRLNSAAPSVTVTR
jgi:hypothetical protein